MAVLKKLTEKVEELGEAEDKVEDHSELDLNSFQTCGEYPKLAKMLIKSKNPTKDMQVILTTCNFLNEIKMEEINEACKTSSAVQTTQNLERLRKECERKYYANLTVDLGKAKRTTQNTPVQNLEEFDDYGENDHESDSDFNVEDSSFDCNQNKRPIFLERAKLKAKRRKVSENREEEIKDVEKKKPKPLKVKVNEVRECPDNEKSICPVCEQPNIEEEKADEMIRSVCYGYKCQHRYHKLCIKNATDDKLKFFINPSMCPYTGCRGYLDRIKLREITDDQLKPIFDAKCILQNLYQYKKILFCENCESLTVFKNKR